MRSILLQRSFIVFSLLSLLAGSSLSSYADCKVNYNQSIELLDSHLQKTQDPKSPHPTDADAFETEFRASVTKLQEEKCLPELMSLIQHIQSEQQKHPRPEKQAMPTPIVD